SFETALAIVAEFGGCHGFKLVGRFGAGEIDHAGRCVASVERSLRPAQYLDLRNVVKFLFEEVIADEGDVVECDGDGRIGGDRDRLRADSADLDRVAGEVCLGESQVRYLLDQIGAACGLCGRQLFLTERGDGDGNALDIGAAKFGRRNRNRLHSGSRGHRLRHLQWRYIARAGTIVPNDGDGAALMPANLKAGAVKNAGKSIVGRNVALHAFRAHAAYRLVGIEKRDAGLAGIGIEGGFEIAAGDVEIGGVGGARENCCGACEQRGSDRVWHLPPQFLERASQREITMLLPWFSTCRPKISCATLAMASTSFVANVPPMVSRPAAASAMTSFFVL